MDIIASVLEDNDLLVAFAAVGVLMLVSGWMSRRLTRGRLHGSAIAIILGLALAGWAGRPPAARTDWPISRSSAASASSADRCCATSPSSPPPTGWISA